MLTASTSFGLCLAVAALGLPARAAAQAPPDIVVQAQNTLTEIVRLIDAIAARRVLEAASARGGGEAWRALFDGATLAGWKQTDFYGGGAARVESPFRGGRAAIVVEAGQSLSGITWTGEAPKSDFEIGLEMMKIKGDDFPCGLTFPVGDSHATLILGGWGGGVVGISSIDGADASENQTTRWREFPPGRWFRVRLRVTPGRLEAWLDDEKIVDQDIAGRKISLRPGPISRSVPIGIATYATSAAFRDIRIRRLPGR